LFILPTNRKKVDPNDPVFDGWDISAPIPWAVAPWDGVGITDVGNGKVLARMESDSTVAFARFELQEAFYDGSGQVSGYHLMRLRWCVDW
jgi:hypothetical protein